MKIDPFLKNLNEQSIRYLSYSDTKFIEFPPSHAGKIILEMSTLSKLHPDYELFFKSSKWKLKNWKSI